MWKKSDFQIIEILGKGMFAEVYKAKELKSKKIVALKIIKKSLILKYKLTNNIRREIEIQSHINYKHIIKLYGYFTDRKNIYIVLEYVKKDTLYSFLKKEIKNEINLQKAQNSKKKLLLKKDMLEKAQNSKQDFMLEEELNSKKEFLLKDENNLQKDFISKKELNLKKEINFFNFDNIKKISYQVALVIKYLNLRHIIHRDIKMENILLDEDFNIKLGDFGWAVHSPNSNIRNTFCGTYAYLAPELCKKKDYDYKVDIWAFGILVYEMFFKRTPFLSKDEKKLQEKIIFEDLEFPASIDDNAMEIIKGCLEKNVRKRWNIDRVLKSKFFEEISK